MTRRWILIGAIILMTLTGAKGCPRDDNPTADHPPAGGVDFPKPAPTPGKYPHNQPHPEAPAEVQNPEPPPADSGPYQDGGHAVFRLVWIGERAGSVEYTVGGASQRIPVPQPVKHLDHYRGIWVKTVTVAKDAVIGFTWFPDARGMWAMCTLYHNGKIVDYQIVLEGPCAVGFKVP
jgi:hypothetical protein